MDCILRENTRIHEKYICRRIYSDKNILPIKPEKIIKDTILKSIKGIKFKN